jgi:hypothetical protein
MPTRPQNPTPQTAESEDIVIGEVRRIKAELARKAGFDVRRTIAEAKEREKASGHLLVCRVDQGA